MKRFAKIFDTEKTQVLMYLAQASSGAPSIKRVCVLQGVGTVESEVEGISTDEECVKAFQGVFDSLDQSAADDFAAQMYEEYDLLLKAANEDRI